MSQKKFLVANNGQAVLTDDFNLLGEVSGLVDDHVYAELLHMPKYDGSTVSRGVILNRHDLGADDGSENGCFVQGAGATGSINVASFRALIGTRTTAGSSPLLNAEDIRSALALGSTTDNKIVSIAANSSGSPRWDLVYAAVSVDANGPAVTRKVKDPTTSVIADTSVVVYKQTTVSISVLAGTPSGTPALPSVPSDSGSTYYIKLAYISVPSGFNGTSVVLPGRIFVVAPVLSIATAAGGARFSWATAHYTPGSSILGTSVTQTWGSSGTAPTMYLGSGGNGAVETVMIAVSAVTGSESPVTGSIVDTRDWRNRIVRVMSVCTDDAFAHTEAWEQGATAVDEPTILPYHLATVESAGSGNQNASMSMAHTCFDPGSSGEIRVARAVSGTSKYVDIRCDLSTGNLLVYYSGTPNCSAIFWLEFSPRIERGA